MKNPWIVVAIAIATATGCSQDDRLSRVVTETTRQQAKQNHSVAELTQQAAENHRLVVEATEQSRAEILSLQGDLHEQRHELEGERRDIASQRYRDSILAPVLQTTGMLLVAALPLVLCWMLLIGIRSGSADEDGCSEVLVHELLAENPWLSSLGRQEGLPQLAEDQAEGDAEPPTLPF